MEIGAITGYIDVAQLVLYAFWVFFFLLVFYLHQEGKREGYPLVEYPEREGRRPFADTRPLMLSPKQFKLANGETLELLTSAPDGRPIAAEPEMKHPGSAFVPTGNPMLDNVGPASYAERQDIPDAAIDGSPKLTPMRLASSFHVVEGDPDPRGMAVIGADGKEGGTVRDIWVDKGEFVIRYLEVDVPDVGLRLLPITMAVVHAGRKQIEVDSILGAQFASVPATKNSDVVTRLEEDKICAYYGGGTLYATPRRSEPLL